MPAGRPTDYNEKIAQEICCAIATTRYGVDRLAKMHPHWPTEKNIFIWIAKHEKFRQLYEKAKLMQIEVLVDQMLDIADDTSNDSYVNDDGKKVCNSEYVNRSRLRIDTRKWLASKLLPKKYGDFKKEDLEKTQDIMSQLLALGKNNNGNAGK